MKITEQVFDNRGGPHFWTHQRAPFDLHRRYSVRHERALKIESILNGFANERWIDYEFILNELKQVVEIRVRGVHDYDCRRVSFRVQRPRFWPRAQRDFDRLVRVATLAKENFPDRRAEMDCMCQD